MTDSEAQAMQAGTLSRQGYTGPAGPERGREAQAEVFSLKGVRVRRWKMTRLMFLWEGP